MMALSALIPIHPAVRPKERPPEFEIVGGHPLASGLVFAGLGRFPNTTRYHDSSLHGNTGTQTSVGWSNELGRWGFLGDGSARYISLEKSFPIANTTPVTVAWWERFTSTTTAYPGVGCISFASGGGNRAIIARVREVDDGAYHHLVMGTVGSNGVACSNIPAPATGSINHVCVRVSAGLVSQTAAEYEFFWNGVSVGNGTGNALLGSTADVVNYIGWEVTAGKFSGNLYDYCVWSRLLAQSEINAVADPSNVMLAVGGMDPGLLRWAPTSRSFRIPIALQSTPVVKALIPLYR